MENSLLLGNGFNRNVFDGEIIDWPGLYKKEKAIKTDNCTLQYEYTRLKNKEKDNAFKNRLMGRVIEPLKLENLKKSIVGIEGFGELLKSHKINNLLTTNVDSCLETILTEKNGYIESTNSLYDETIYSIRRKKTFISDEHELNLWKIHGDISTISSVSLGFDQYCGSIAKMYDYTRGEYISKDAPEKRCDVSIEDKLKKIGNYDKISWIELFFKTNLYIACFGLDYSEIDIWWLLNERKRLMEDKDAPVENKIYYLYNGYDNGEKGRDRKNRAKAFRIKKKLLNSLNVECIKIESGDELIPNIMKEIK